MILNFISIILTGLLLKFDFYKSLFKLFVFFVMSKLISFKLTISLASRE
jgi:hypothetical protein